jgi:hypothetical protein
MVIASVWAIVDGVPIAAMADFARHRTRADADKARREVVMASRSEGGLRGG